jgi:hypothetical protein
MSLSAEWLDMVKKNRMNGGIQHNYDIVWGPVADDNTMRTLALFVADIYDAETALRQLMFFQDKRSGIYSHGECAGKT